MVVLDIIKHEKSIMILINNLLNNLSKYLLFSMSELNSILFLTNFRLFFNFFRILSPLKLYADYLKI